MFLSVREGDYDFKWDFFNVGVWLLWVLMVGMVELLVV